MTGDQRDLLIFLSICLIVPAGFVLLWTWIRPDWSDRKVIMSSASPIPAVVWLLCIFVFLNALFASKEECGVDACGMAMGFSVIIAVAAFAGLGVGVLSAWLMRRLLKSR
jgi:hypothetical protein